MLDDISVFISTDHSETKMEPVLGKGQECLSTAQDFLTLVSMSCQEHLSSVTGTSRVPAGNQKHHC